MEQALFEDGYSDILKKAMFGLGIGEAAASTRTGVEPSVIRNLLGGASNPDQNALTALAGLLGLSPEKLVKFALNADLPRNVAIPPTLEIMASESSNCANTYIFRCQTSGASFIVDPGANAGGVAAMAKKDGAKPGGIILTHGHSDHTGAALDLSIALNVPIMVLDREKEELAGASRVSFVAPGYAFKSAPFIVRFLHVPGHTAGHAVIVVQGAGYAFTGDALFARSVGYASESGKAYSTLLSGVREKVLGLPWDTILCPGHGPITTVADEKALNPFFV